MFHRLIDLGKKLDENETEALRKIADSLNNLGRSENAISIYKRLGEIESVLKLHIGLKNWPLAFSLIEQYPQHENILYIPYARWLVENDNFVEAQKGERTVRLPQAIFSFEF